MLSFYFLGAPRLEKNGKLLNLDTRKAVALAAYLALTSRTHERDELAALFYPEAETARARAALRRTLSTLKTALGDKTLDVERETIGLDTQAVSVDVLEFRALVQQKTFQSLTRAAQLYRGDFMDGFTLRDSPAFDEWQFFETESLRKQFAAALEQLVALQTERGALKSAIESARRWLALDPLHEPAHRALMLLYARDGQRAAALRQYQECVRQLGHELGVTPLPETTALYHTIQENRLPAEARPASAAARAPEPTSPRSVEYPLVGRGAELALLMREYNRTGTQGTLLILQGEAGIGKTRLAQEFLAQVAQEGGAILTARAYLEQRALAYAPLAQALRAALQEPYNAERVRALAPYVLADAARLVPELVPGASLDTTIPNQASVSPVTAVGAQARFFDAITRIILQLTQKHSTQQVTAPGVLFVDDAQWLDEASLDLVAFIIRRLKSTSLCILLTWRGEEVGREHILRRLYADALREERAHLITLTRLAQSDAQTLVDVATHRGAQITPALAARLYRESEGQPFFLIETLKLIEREGDLGADMTLPASVRELLHSRLTQASETARQVLGAGAVIGRSFDLELVQPVSGRSDQETIDGLEELASKGLITESNRAGAPQYDFTHEKLRALVYEETSLARRRLLHRRAAETLIRASRAQSDTSAAAMAASIAHHARAGGEDARAAEYYKRAGDYARSVFANRDAVEYYSAALALGDSDAAALHTGIGDAQTLLGDYDAALASYETSAAFGASTADANMARVYLRRGEWAHAARHLTSALEMNQELAAQARLLAELALACHQSHNEADALKHAKRSLNLAQRAGGKSKTGEPAPAQMYALAQAHNILGILARTRGEWEDARKHLEASRALAEQMNDAGAHAAALNNLALVARATHDDEHALALTCRALELVTRAGDRHRQAALHNHLADLYHALGRELDSMEQLKFAVAIYAEIGGPVGAWQPEIWKLEEW